MQSQNNSRPNTVPEILAQTAPETPGLTQFRKSWSKETRKGWTPSCQLPSQSTSPGSDEIQHQLSPTHLPASSTVISNLDTHPPIINRYVLIAALDAVWSGVKHQKFKHHSRNNKLDLMKTVINLNLNERRDEESCW